MRRALIILISAISFSTSEAQLLAGENKYEGEIIVSENYNLDLKQLVHQWVIQEYDAINDIKTVFESQKGEYLIHSAFDVNTLGSSKTIFAGNIFYSVSLRVKDNKVHYLINNFKHYTSSTSYGSGGALSETKPQCKTCLLSTKNWTFIKVDANLKVNSLIKDLQEHIGHNAIVDELKHY